MSDEKKQKHRFPNIDTKTSMHVKNIDIGSKTSMFSIVPMSMLLPLTVSIYRPRRPVVTHPSTDPTPTLFLCLFLSFKYSFRVEGRNQH